MNPNAFATCTTRASMFTSYAGADAPQEARLVDEFRLAIDDLGNIVEELRVRTLPVSRPEYAEPNCESECPSSQARTELYRLHALSGALRGILDRLEV